MADKPHPQLDDVQAFIADCVKSPEKSNYSNYGYEIWLPYIVVSYIQKIEHSTEHSTSIYNSERAAELSPMFYEAAWEWCRRGILRPGVRRSGLQATDSGSGGDGYSLTSSGRKWIISGGGGPLLLDIGRTAALFKKLSYRFGAAFSQRAIEASYCHQFGNYLACCAMCGAAAESILLAVAIEKSGDEAKTLSVYRSASGRRKITDNVAGKLPLTLASQFQSATALLSFWRDDAAHGSVSNISETEAHEALARLLRLAQFADDNWSNLTAS